MKQGNLYAKRIASTDESRQELFEILRSRGDTGASSSSKVSFDEYLGELKQYRFVACPRGNGVDTHRLWETIYLGSTPVITITELHRAVCSNHCHVLKNWEELLHFDGSSATLNGGKFLDKGYILSGFKSFIEEYRGGA